MFWNNFASIIIFLYTITVILIVLHSFPFLFCNNTKLVMKKKTFPFLSFFRRDRASVLVFHYETNIWHNQIIKRKDPLTHDFRVHGCLFCLSRLIVKYTEARIHGWMKLLAHSSLETTRRWLARVPTSLQWCAPNDLRTRSYF